MRRNWGARDAARVALRRSADRAPRRPAAPASLKTLSRLVGRSERRPCRAESFSPSRTPRGLPPQPKANLCPFPENPAALFIFMTMKFLPANQPLLGFKDRNTAQSIHPPPDGCIMRPMSELRPANQACGPANAPEGSPASERRPPGARPGNRNAFKHGRYGAAARAERAEKRARCLACLSPCEKNSTNKSNNYVSTEGRAAEAGVEGNFPPNKSNNSIAGVEPGAAENFLPNKWNNYVSIESETRRRRGAPKGNKNALKHGLRTPEFRAFDDELRNLLRRARLHIAHDKACALYEKMQQRRARANERATEARPAPSTSKEPKRLRGLNMSPNPIGQFGLGEREPRSPAEHAGEDGVDMLQVIVEIEQFLELGRRQRTRDLLVRLEQGEQIALAVPRPHGVPLHEGVGLLTAHAGLRQRQQHALAVHQAPRAFEIGLHALGIDQQLVDDGGGAHQREVERDGGIGSDIALDRGMRDVALVPERHVFQRRHDIGAHHAGEPGEVLAQDRIALVRHGGGALLAFREILLGLQHFAALQMADLGGQPLERARGDGEGREIGGVAVARNHLRRDGLGLEAQLGGDMRLPRRSDMGEGADRAENGADGNLLAPRDEPRPRPRGDFR